MPSAHRLLSEACRSQPCLSLHLWVLQCAHAVFQDWCTTPILTAQCMHSAHRLLSEAGRSHTSTNAILWCGNSAFDCWCAPAGSNFAHVVCIEELAVCDHDPLHREDLSSQLCNSQSDLVRLVVGSEDGHSPWCQVLQALSSQETICCAEADLQLNLLLNFSYNALTSLVLRKQHSV